MADEQRQLLSGLEPSGGMALLARGPLDPWLGDELRVAWRAAHEEAVEAYRVWRGTGGGELYAAYRAAQDRADAAQDALALSAGVAR